MNDVDLLKGMARSVRDHLLPELTSPFATGQAEALAALLDQVGDKIVPRNPNYSLTPEQHRLLTGTLPGDPAWQQCARELTCYAVEVWEQLTPFPWEKLANA